jgi:hypothetical protein
VPGPAIDPRLDERDAGEAREAADLLVDAPGGGAPVGAGEQIRGEEARLLLGLLRAPDRLPEAVDEQAGDARRRRPREALLGLV